MTVNNWFSSGCDYKKGVEIYKQQPKANKNFIKVFELKESMQNLMKLKYELQKLMVPTNSKNTTPNRNIQISIDASEKPKSKTESKYFRKLFISQLPTQLHPLYIQQKNDYMKYCSLKMQLNSLTHQKDKFGNLIIGTDGLPKLKEQTPLDIEVAQKICLEIEMLFDAIDKTWQIIDHYLQTREILVIQEKSFTDLSPGKLRDKINSIRGSRTRQKQRKAMLQESLNNAIAKKFKIKYARDLAKCEQKLAQYEQDLIQLIKIRDNEK